MVCKFTGRDSTRLDIEVKKKKKKIDSLERNMERECAQKFDSFDYSSSFSSKSLEFLVTSKKVSVIKMH